MAVIKQRRQFLPQSIGVVRANTGAAEVARSVGGLADAMIETSFDELKKQARDRGIEVAQAASIADLRAINPVTGEPEAFVVPSGFGREAADAYEELIERRYIAQTEQDFKIKARELAIELENDPNGVAKFSSQFGTFVEESAANASPKFENIISNIGSALLASNKLSLQQEANKRERQNLADQLGLDISDAGRALSTLTGSVNYKSGSSSYVDAGLLLDEKLKEIDLAVKSNVISEPKAEELRRVLTQSMYAGSAQRIVAKINDLENADSQTVNDIRIAIQSGNLDNVPEELRPEIENIINDEQFYLYRDDFNSKLTTFQAALNQREVAAKQAQTELEKDEQKAKDLAKFEATAGISEIRQTTDDQIIDLIDSGDLSGAVKMLNTFKLALDKKGDLITETLRNSSFQASRQLLITRLINKANQLTNTAEMKEFTDYVVNEGRIAADMSNEVKELADTIVEVADYGFDRALIERDSEDFVSDKAAVDSANAESSSIIEAREDIANEIGNPKSSKHRKVIENDILDTYAPGQSAVWFLTEDGLVSSGVWSKDVVKAGVLPDFLVETVRTLIDGQIDSKRAPIAAQYYAMFGNIRQAGSSKEINMFNYAGFNEEEIGLLEGALYGASMLEGGFAENFATVLADLRSKRDNPAVFEAQKARFLGDQTLNEFIGEVTTDRGFFGDPNANAALEMRGFVEYQIAAGKSREMVEEDLKRYFDQSYFPLQGVVIDPAFQEANRSRQALGARFGNKVPAVVGVMNDMLAEMGVNDARFLLDSIGRGQRGDRSRRRRGIEPEQAPTDIDIEMRLMPLPFAGGAKTEDVRYMAMYIDNNGDVVPYVRQTEDGPEFIYFSLDDIERRYKQSR
tara:strand:- start:1425 stop:4007 length:2583 start_codon:yes stop_codon:yes gene_type:complete